MRRTGIAAERAVRAVLRQQNDLITRSQALTAGMTRDALRYKLRADGSWNIVLPGVYLGHNGQLTVGQREVATMLYAGRGCVITGLAALARLGVRSPLSEAVDVLIPEARKRQSTGFVRVHRTTRMPERPVVIDGIPWAPPARAVADAARGSIEWRDIRDVVANAVQQGKCTVGQLAAELRGGPSRGSGALRVVLEEAADGIASVAEGDLRVLIKSGGLPEPMYNPRLYVGSEFLAQPDAYWHDAGVACQVDSREFHLSASQWDNDLARHAAMSAHGIIVVHLTPRRLRVASAEVLSQLRSTLDKGRQRPPLLVRALPSRQRERD